MIELNRHIEILLLENECVIVPDFGGFMTHHVAAHYDADDHSFIPPMRTLGFNPQLRMNDSVLVQSYVEAYDISYPEALRRIEEEVDEMKDILEEVGCYTLNDLGMLTVNQEGNYEFEPCEAGILSPSLYGLGAFPFSKLKDEKPVEQPVAQEVAIEPTAAATEEQPTLIEFAENNESEQESDTLHIKMSWVRNSIAVAAAIIAFFFMSTPIVNSDLDTRTMSQLQNNLIYKLMPKDSNVVPAEPVKDTIPATKKVKEPQTAISQNKTAETPAATKRYCIVLASQVKKSNAEIFVEQLHQQGYAEAKLFIYNDVVRVICGEFETENEAYEKLQKLHKKSGFEEAWVFKKKLESSNKQQAEV